MVKSGSFEVFSTAFYLKKERQFTSLDCYGFSFFYSLFLLRMLGFCQ